VLSVPLLWEAWQKGWNAVSIVLRCSSLRSLIIYGLLAIPLKLQQPIIIHNGNSIRLSVGGIVRHWWKLNLRLLPLTAFLRFSGCGEKWQLLLVSRFNDLRHWKPATSKKPLACVRSRLQPCYWPIHTFAGFNPHLLEPQTSTNCWSLPRIFGVRIPVCGPSLHWYCSSTHWWSKRMSMACRLV